VRGAGHMHAHAYGRGVFGAPAPVLSDGHAAVIQFDAVPDADQGRPLLKHLRQLTVAPPVSRGGRRVTTAGCG